MSLMHKDIDFRTPPKPPETPGLYTTAEVAEIFRWKSRQMVWRVAVKEKWEARKAHRHMTLYRAEDVLRYWEIRRRTEMLYRAGLTARGLVRAPRPGEADIACPVCSAYAYSTPAGFACVNHHHRRAR
jgi:hypothetical protein